MEQAYLTIEEEQKKQQALIIKTINYSLLGLIAIILILSSWTKIDAGERGVVLRLGKVVRIMQPGLNLKFPLIEKAIKMEVRTVKIEAGATAASRDLQDVTTNIALQFSLNADRVGQIYEEYETQIHARIIDTAIQDAVKAATAKFNAEDLITRRPEVKEAMEVILKERLTPENITVSNLDIIDFKFSPSFSIAIEEKVTAEQNAAREENKLKQVQFEAQQRITQAKGEAEAIKIQAEAVNSQGGADYVQLQAIAKWNGILPNQFVPGSAIPFLNLIK